MSFLVAGVRLLVVEAGWSDRRITRVVDFRITGVCDYAICQSCNQATP